MHASQADGRQFDVCRGISNFVCKSLTCQTVTSLVFFLYLTLYNFFSFLFNLRIFPYFHKKKTFFSRPQDAPWKVLLLRKLSKLMKTYIAKFYETLRFLSLKWLADCRPSCSYMSLSNCLTTSTVNLTFKNVPQKVVPLRYFNERKAKYIENQFCHIYFINFLAFGKLLDTHSDLFSRRFILLRKYARLYQ